MRQGRLSLIFTAALIALTLPLWFLMLRAVGLPAEIALFGTAGFLLFNLLMVAISYSVRLFTQRQALARKKQRGDDSGDSHQQRTVEIDLPFDAAYDLALEALATLDGQDVPLPDTPMGRLEALVPRRQALRVYETDRAMGTLRAVLRARTFGIPDVVDFTRLDVQLQRVDDATTRVRIESRANRLVDDYDSGKNLHYVRLLATHLRRATGQDAAGEQEEGVETAGQDTLTQQRR